MQTGKVLAYLAAMIDLKSYIRNVPDFPQPGILFRDISPLLREAFGATIEALSTLLDEREWRQVDAVAGIESRGFILASALALRHRKGFVLVRNLILPVGFETLLDIDPVGVLEVEQRARRNRHRQKSIVEIRHHRQASRFGMSSLSSLVIMSFRRSFLFLRRWIRIESECLVSIMYLITSSRSRCSMRSSSNHLAISAGSIANSSVAQPWHDKRVPIAHKGTSLV